MQLITGIIEVKLITIKEDQAVTVRFDIKANTITFMKKDKELFSVSACEADETYKFLKGIHKTACGSGNDIPFNYSATNAIIGGSASYTQLSQQLLGRYP